MTTLDDYKAKLREIIELSGIRKYDIKDLAKQQLALIEALDKIWDLPSRPGDGVDIASTIAEEALDGLWK